jgi:hypothetical protein
MTTWESFRDAIKEQYYPVRSYDDLYTKWTTLWQERDQAVPDFTNIFHTLHTKMGIKDSKQHLVLKYHGALHRYIQTKMEFLDISSLGAAYRYAVKIEQKLKQKTWQFGPGNPSQQKPRKGWPQPTEQRTEKIWIVSGQPVQAASKEGHHKDKERYRKWCDFHKSPWHNTADCRSKQSLVAEVKASESDVDSDSEPEPERGRWIIDMEPSATIATTKLHPGEPDELEEGEHLFHSQMWVKGTLLHFIIDSGSQKNLISAEVIKRLALPTTSHPQPYTIGWLHQGSDLHVSQQCRLSYDIKPFKDEVLCDVSPLEVCDVLLGQPYLWKCHVVYESRPRSVIITLNRKLYRIPEAVPPSAISLISAKQCRKVISQMGKFVFFMILS